MDDATNHFLNSPFDAGRYARDPEYRKQCDDEDRKYDDTSDGIDWDEIIASTQDEIDSGDYAFCSGDYPAAWNSCAGAHGEMRFGASRSSMLRPSVRFTEG